MYGHTHYCHHCEPMASNCRSVFTCLFMENQKTLFSCDQRYDQAQVRFDVSSKFTHSRCCEWASHTQMPKSKKLLHEPSLQQYWSLDQCTHHFLWWTSMDRLKNRFTSLYHLCRICDDRHVFPRFWSLANSTSFDCYRTTDDNWDHETVWLGNKVECKPWN